MKRIILPVSSIIDVVLIIVSTYFLFVKLTFACFVQLAISKITEIPTNILVARKNRGLWQLNPAFEKYGFARDTSYIYDGDTITIAEVIIKEKL